MSWFSEMFRTPGFDSLNTDKLYESANRYRDPYSSYNRSMYNQIARAGQDALGTYGMQGQRLAGMGANPFADSQFAAERRKIQDQTYGAFNQAMTGQHQLAATYDQLGMQGDQFNIQNKIQAEQWGRQNRSALFGSLLGAIGLGGRGLGGWLSGFGNTNPAQGGLPVPPFSD